MREADTKTDVGLRGTCAYYQCFGTVCAMCMCAAGFWGCDVLLHFCTLFWAKGQDFLFQNSFKGCSELEKAGLKQEKDILNQERAFQNRKMTF